MSSDSGMGGPPAADWLVDGWVDNGDCSHRRDLLLASRENQALRLANAQLSQALADLGVQSAAARHMAHHDSLTGLPNRQLLLRRLEEGIVDCRARKTALAVMFIDLDGFKLVNDGHGHSTGDQLLTAVASRISACIREDDLACRYGGDEFVVMLGDLADAAVAPRIAEEIRSRIEDCYQIDGQQLQLSASIGIATYPDDGDRWDSLLRWADASMYRDKLHRPARMRRLLAAHAPALMTGPLPGLEVGKVEGPAYMRYQTAAWRIPM